MKLKKKVFILHFFIACSIVITFLFFYKFHFTSALTKLKTQRAEVLIKGVQILFDNEVLRISRSSDDTASWDTMYRYVQNPTKEIEQDMAPYLFIKYMKLSLYAVINKSKEVILLTGYDQKTDSKIEFDSLRNRQGAIWDFLLESLDLKTTHDHLISTPHGIIIVVSSPILLSDGSGPERGKVLIGHLLDENFFVDVSATLGEKVDFRKRDFEPDSGELLVNNGKYRLYVDETHLEIITDVFDTHGKYAFTYGIKSKKNITNTFKEIIFKYTSGLLLIFLIAGTVIFIFFNKVILKKIEYISRKTTQIVTSDDLSVTFMVSSDDEICLLKRNLNDMLKRMRKEIKRTLDAQNALMLNEKMIFLGNVTANIAHEVINPLFAVSNAIEYLKKTDCCKDREMHEALDIIENETARVREIAMNLNRYSIQKSLSFSKVNLKEVLTAAIMVAKWSRNIDEIKFITNLPEDVLPLYCNPGAFQQVFINLIINAIDALNGEGEISINVFRKESVYTIEFTDNGPGFDKAIIRNAFESFKSTKKGKGAGLGLYISYNIVNDHGGSIFIDGAYRDGAKIIILIPEGGGTHGEK